MGNETFYGGGLTRKSKTIKNDVLSFTAANVTSKMSFGEFKGLLTWNILRKWNITLGFERTDCRISFDSSFSLFLALYFLMHLHFTVQTLNHVFKRPGVSKKVLKDIEKILLKLTVISAEVKTVFASPNCRRRKNGGKHEKRRENGHVILFI